MNRRAVADKRIKIWNVNKKHYLCILITLRVDKKKQNIAYFLSFCIEQYKNEHHLSGAEAMRLFADYGLLDYLSEHYEVLHTQSRQWLMEDIEEFIKLRKEENA